MPTKVSELTNDSGYTTNTGTVTQVKVGSTTYNPSSGVISLPAYTTDTNTHRPIQVNGTEVLGNNTTALNLKAGSNVSISNSNGTVTISSTDTNTTYSAGTGISLSGTTFSNSGVRSITTGSTNGTISVNTNGTSVDVAVKGLGSAAYTNSSAYASASALNGYLPLTGGALTGNLYFSNSLLSKYYGSFIHNGYGNYFNLYCSAQEPDPTHEGDLIVTGEVDSGDSKRGTTIQSVITVRPGEYCDYAYLGNEDYSWNGTYTDLLYLTGNRTGTGSTLVITSNNEVVKQSSSRKVKKDIEYVNNSETYHNALMNFKPATFIYKNDNTNTTKLGMIAEDVADECAIAGMEKLIPIYGEDKKEVIDYEHTGEIENYDDRAIIAMLVMEVQRLNKKIEELENN